MPLAPPILDDVDFGQLVKMAVDKVKQECPEWTDLTPGDPGMVLLELYAHLTEIMVYRHNQIPEKAYIEFLNLLGVSLRPPAAATAWLRFSATGTLKAPIEIPRGTRVSATQATAGGEAPVFVTAKALTLTSAAPAGEVEAYNCEIIEESAGFGTGRPGQHVAVRQPPIIAPTGDDLDLIVGVELGAGEPPTDERSREFGGKTYRIWREVQNFAESDDDPYVFVADRMKGTIEFAPAVGAGEGPAPRVPPEGREIRIRYRRGGGVGGNVLPDALKVLKDPIPGVEVTNPRAATGGSAGETLAEALRRGPREFHSRGRAVTARDFEYIVTQRFGGAIARARAFTKKDLWQYAAPGTVQVLLVPNYLQMKERGERPITAQELVAQQNEQVLAKVQGALDKARPLGTTCLVNWTKYKTISIKATIYAFPEEDEAQLRSRVSKRLYELINPLPTESRLSGWPFGRALRAFDVYEIIDREPGVASAGDVRLIVDDAPGKDVFAVASDPFQKDTWYANAGSRVFRSNNRCDSWEAVAEFAPANAVRLSVSPEHAGMVAVCSVPPKNSAPVAVHVSRDCGESWMQAAQFEFAVEDLCWSARDGQPLLLLATAKGLYELAIVDVPIPQPIAVDPNAPETPLWSVAATTTDRGTPIVAVALQQNGGVMLREGANSNFAEWGLKDEDVRLLEIQSYQKRRYLWAGVYARGLEGGGCHRRELELGVDQSWTAFTDNWKGGSCRSIAFGGARVMAGTFRGGVLWLDSDRPNPQWQLPDLRCGLPVESEAKLFTQINSVATPPPGAKSKYSVVVCGPAGVFRAGANLNAYESCSQVEFQEAVNIPQGWLLCSGTHELKVVVQGEDDGT